MDLNQLMIYAWGAIAIIFIIIELACTGILQIWFAIGAVCAAIVAWLVPDSIIIQLLVFLIVSAILTFIGSKIFKQKNNDEKHSHNRVYSILDKEAVVSVEIDNAKGTGKITINGDVWSAKTRTDEVVPENTKVKVVDIDGVKAVVEIINE